MYGETKMERKKIEMKNVSVEIVKMSGSVTVYVWDLKTRKILKSIDINESKNLKRVWISNHEDILRF